ncbi:MULTISPECIES: CPBP family intramembrane glutamic endopeptidase [Gammaproteobacteria]|uniref:CPBP family intramembrane glutamic endopeptidase n=1 Tax=Gammaproteobacteria TaxID=1236 RepID=UPI0019128D8D|nr:MULTISPECIES: CPBP family intramembrane glutamic endopeptidase [Gammaproteobacteria]MBK5305034.1 CPBP family intramembrane metalloprotease [Bacillus sp. TH86]MBK5324803.1 CPBP family intramembrane metalloprotease [Bacillus sp. TH59]MBK5339753.1 CPBP family intramembrane metalloprotease [Bacillus sp. TH57]MBK5313799.1 CPBP family intramembrane metalloprotease [Pseudomonas sp. TH71]MBK5319299.1 CPBP family intramembrane metalloprotease [Erwinia sp. TH79]
MITVYYLIIFSVLPFLEGGWQLTSMACAAILVGLVVTKVKAGSHSLFGLFVMVAAISRVEYFQLPWPVPLVVPIAAYAYIDSKRREKAGFKWWPGKEEWRASTWSYSILGAGCATLGLFVWYSIVSPDFSRFTAMIPHLSWWIIIPAGVAFYCINAAVEEWIFRGILFKELSFSGVSIGWIILFQAVSFGCLHWQGIPGGKAGVLLSGLYGVVQGWVRWRSGGLLAPWMSHVVADLVIFSLVLQSLA